MFVVGHLRVNGLHLEALAFGKYAIPAIAGSRTPRFRTAGTRRTRARRTRARRTRHAARGRPPARRCVVAATPRLAAWKTLLAADADNPLVMVHLEDHRTSRARGGPTRASASSSSRTKWSTRGASTPSPDAVDAIHRRSVDGVDPGSDGERARDPWWAPSPAPFAVRRGAGRPHAALMSTSGGVANEHPGGRVSTHPRAHEGELPRGVGPLPPPRRHHRVLTPSAPP